jgi:regulator of cell morphogenesis and NO signaling
MSTLTEKTIGELVAEDYRTASIFEQYGIDFCCNGNRNLTEACADKNIRPEELLSKIDRVQQETKSNLPDFQSWPADLLVDYIEKKHHRYIEETIPVLKQYLEKIGQVHGNNHPELLKIAALFSASAGELTAHMKKEEFILFPYIRKMVKVRNSGEQPEHPLFGTVANPIQMMMQEHDHEGVRFREISRLSNTYTPPEDACNTYRVAYATLKEFEDDLHQHIHLENNILFPRALAMEKELTYE